jgi:hypothetical protein
MASMAIPDRAPPRIPAHPEGVGGPEDVVWAQPWERGRPRPPLHAPALRDW